jgi:hypothetical protein
MSRVPTFRRRFRNLVKVLYIEAIQGGASGNHMGGILEARYGNNSCNQSEDKNDRDETINKGEHKEYDNGNLV